MTNAEIAELLAREAETESSIPDRRRRAFQRASRAALSWPHSAASIACQGVSLAKELRSVGPYLQSVLMHWLEAKPDVPEPPPIRRHFTSRAQVLEKLRHGDGQSLNIRGDLHVHSEWSDGKDTLLELAESAEARGYSYLAVTDHAAKLPVAKGLKLDKLLRQGQKIKELNEELCFRGFRVRLLRSSELNFTKRGEVDYEPHILKELDITIAAYHSGLRTTEDQTERYLAALTNPYVDIHAHPVCRIYNQRLGLQANWDRVFGKGAELGKAFEIDGIPDRQDLSAPLLALARKHDVYISLGSDSHSIDHLEYINFASMAALEAGIRHERILNLMTFGELLDWREKRLEDHLVKHGEMEFRLA